MELLVLEPYLQYTRSPDEAPSALLYALVALRT